MLVIDARDGHSPRKPELLFRPVFRVTTGFELPWQWCRMGMTIRGVMARIFLTERIVIYAAAQQSSIRPSPKCSNEPILLIFWAFFVEICHFRCLVVRNLRRTCPAPHRTGYGVLAPQFLYGQTTDSRKATVSNNRRAPDGVGRSDADTTHVSVTGPHEHPVLKAQCAMPPPASEKPSTHEIQSGLCNSHIFRRKLSASVHVSDS
jgi:hypothetical protein